MDDSSTMPLLKPPPNVEEDDASHQSDREGIASLPASVEPSSESASEECASESDSQSSESSNAKDGDDQSADEAESRSSCKRPTENAEITKETSESEESDIATSHLSDSEEGDDNLIEEEDMNTKKLPKPLHFNRNSSLDSEGEGDGSRRDNISDSSASEAESSALAGKNRHSKEGSSNTLRRQALQRYFPEQPVSGSDDRCSSKRSAEPRGKESSLEGNRDTEENISAQEVRISRLRQSLADIAENSSESSRDPSSALAESSSSDNYEGEDKGPKKLKARKKLTLRRSLTAESSSTDESSTGGSGDGGETSEQYSVDEEAQEGTFDDVLDAASSISMGDDFSFHSSSQESIDALKSDRGVTAEQSKKVSTTKSPRKPLVVNLNPAAKRETTTGQTAPLADDDESDIEFDPSEDSVDLMEEAMVQVKAEGMDIKPCKGDEGRVNEGNGDDEKLIQEDGAKGDPPTTDIDVIELEDDTAPGTTALPAKNGCYDNDGNVSDPSSLVPGVKTPPFGGSATAEARDASSSPCGEKEDRMSLLCSEYSSLLAPGSVFVPVRGISLSRLPDRGTFGVVFENLSVCPTNNAATRSVAVVLEGIAVTEKSPMRVGDVVVSVHGTDVSALGFGGTLDLMRKTNQCPLVLDVLRQIPARDNVASMDREAMHTPFKPSSQCSKSDSSEEIIEPLPWTRHSSDAAAAPTRVRAIGKGTASSFEPLRNVASTLHGAPPSIIRGVELYRWPNGTFGVICRQKFLENIQMHNGMKIADVAVIEGGRSVDAGIVQMGDVIAAVNGMDLSHVGFDGIIKALRSYRGNPLVLDVLRRLRGGPIPVPQGQPQTGALWDSFRGVWLFAKTMQPLCDENGFYPCPPQLSYSDDMTWDTVYGVWRRNSIRRSGVQECNGKEASQARREKRDVSCREERRVIEVFPEGKYESNEETSPLSDGNHETRMVWESIAAYQKMARGEDGQRPARSYQGQLQQNSTYSRPLNKKRTEVPFQSSGETELSVTENSGDVCDSSPKVRIVSDGKSKTRVEWDAARNMCVVAVGKRPSTEPSSEQQLQSTGEATSSAVTNSRTVQMRRVWDPAKGMIWVAEGTFDEKNNSQGSGYLHSSSRASTSMPAQASPATVVIVRSPINSQGDVLNAAIRLSHFENLLLANTELFTLRLHEGASGSQRLPCFSLFPKGQRNLGVVGIRCRWCRPDPPADLSQHTDDPYFFPREPEGLARILKFGFGAAGAHFDNCPGLTNPELSRIRSARANRYKGLKWLDGDTIRSIFKCFKLDQRVVWAAYRRGKIVSSAGSSIEPMATHAVPGVPLNRLGERRQGWGLNSNYGESSTSHYDVRERAATPASNRFLKKRGSDSAVDSSDDESSGFYSLYSDSEEDPSEDSDGFSIWSSQYENIVEEDESSSVQSDALSSASTESKEDELMYLSGLDTALEVAFQLQRTGCAVSDSSEYHSLLTSAPRHLPAQSAGSFDNFNPIMETLRSWSAFSSLSVFCKAIIQSIVFVPISKEHWSSYFKGTAQFLQLSSDIVAAGICCRHCGEIFPIFSMQTLGDTLQQVGKIHLSKDCQLVQNKMRFAIMQTALLTQEAESKQLTHLYRLCQTILLKLGPKVFVAESIVDWESKCSPRRWQKKRKLISPEKLDSLKKERGPGSWVCDAELPDGEMGRLYRENRHRH